MKVQEVLLRGEDDDRKSTVKQILHKSTDLLRRIIAPVGGQGGVTLSYVCLHCHETREEAEQLVVRGARRPVRLDEPEQ